MAVEFNLHSVGCCCLSTLTVCNHSLKGTQTLLLQEGAQLVKKIGGVFAFKVKDGPGGKEATWIVDVKNGNGSVTNDPGM